MKKLFFDGQEEIFPDSTFLNLKGEKVLQKVLNKVTEKKYYSTKKTLIFFKKRGLPISKSKLYKLTSAGKIPFSKFNNKLIFEKMELLIWIEGQRKDILDKRIQSAVLLSKSANLKLNPKR